jgi:hypothetical protein
VEVVSVPAQWARQSAEIRSSAQQFHTGAVKDMKSDHHLQSKRLSLFQQSGIAQSVVFLLAVIATIHRVP